MTDDEIDEPQGDWGDLVFWGGDLPPGPGLLGAYGNDQRLVNLAAAHDESEAQDE